MAIVRPWATCKEMTANYKILCDIGDKPNFIIGGQGESVDFNEIEKSENLNRIYRFQFKQPPKTDNSTE